MYIKENLLQVYEKIKRAEEKAGRVPNSVELLVVSKFQTIENIQKIIQAGHTIFGENRVQEAVEKFNTIRQTYPKIHLHFIGSLQRNKVKSIVPIAQCIESVDRIELLQEIGKTTQVLQKPIDILFEYHTAEQTKAGYTNLKDLFTSIDLLQQYPNINCKGLMTMAPFTKDKKIIRASFSTLKKIQEKCQKKYPQLDFSCLSMGMSQDYEIAIEEGSTRIRIGTAVFGARP